MRHVLTLIISILFINTNFAQLSIGINIGSSMPQGIYAKNNLDEENARFAKIGFTGELDFKWYLSKNFGLQSRMGHTVHGFDIKGLESDDETMIIANNMDPYRYTYLTLGPSIRVGENKLALSINPFIGTVLNHGYSWNLDDADFPEYGFEADFESQTLLYFGGYIDISYDIKDKFFLNLSGGYKTTKSIDERAYIKHNNENIGEVDAMEDIGTRNNFDVLIGIGYRF